MSRLLTANTTTPQPLQEHIEDMDNFNEADHPRGGNPGNPGQFSAKTHREAECSLDDHDPLEGLSPNERVNLAADPNTSTEILTRLSEDEDSWVRWGVAENPNTPAEILNRLSKDKDQEVRWGVAENPNTPAEILNRLSKDQGSHVRWGVTKNLHAPIEVLARLSKDEDPNVRFAAQQALEARANAG